MRREQEIAEGSSANPSACHFNPSYLCISFSFVLSSVLLSEKRNKTEREREREKRIEKEERDKNSEPEVHGLKRKQKFLMKCNVSFPVVSISQNGLLPEEEWF
jgi:hypothetical protein